MTQNNSTNNKSKYPFIKKILIIIAVIYIVFYILSKISMYSLEINTKNVFEETNNLLLKQKFKLDHVIFSPYADGSDLFDLKISNPPNFSNLVLLHAPEIRLNSAYSTNSSKPIIAITSVFIKKAIINYEINNKKEVNIHKALESIISRLAPNANYSPASILSSGGQPESSTPLNYNGVKFFLGDVIFVEPIINIYSNGKLIKKFTTDDLILKFHTVKQPLHYGDALLAGSLQFVERLDNIIKQ